MSDNHDDFGGLARDFVPSLTDARRWQRSESCPLECLRPHVGQALALQRNQPKALQVHLVLLRRRPTLRKSGKQHQAQRQLQSGPPTPSRPMDPSAPRRPSARVSRGCLPRGLFPGGSWQRAGLQRCWRPEVGGAGFDRGGHSRGVSWQRVGALTGLKTRVFTGTPVGAGSPLR